MAQSKNAKEHEKAVRLLGYNFKLIRDKKQAWDDLIRLTQDKDANGPCICY